MKKPAFKQLLPIIIIVCGIAIFALLKATQPSSEPASVNERSWSVEVLSANLQQLSPSLTLYGNIETPALVNAAAPKNSRVSQIYVREGDPIIKGQLLLALDERDYKSRLKQAIAKVTELKALIKSENYRYKADKKSYLYEKSILDLGQSAVKRAKMLKNKSLGSTATWEQAQENLKHQQLAFTTRELSLEDHSARLQQLQARLSYAEAEVELTELDLERSQIMALFDGYVEKLSVSIGDQVKENQILLTTYSTEQLEVRAKIPVAFQNEIQKSLHHKQQLMASADYAGEPLQLVLNRISGIADARGVDALFHITQGHQWVRPGSSISVSLQRPVQKNVMILPYAALYDNNRIYRVVNQRLQKINVQISGDYLDEQQREQLLVFSPQLQQGDNVLVTHLPNAISGLKVELSQPSL